MKNLFYIFIALIPALYSCGGKEKNHREDKEVKAPAAVETAFSKQFPATGEVEWSKDSLNYEAEFEVDEKEMSATYDSTGNLLETENEINISDLPPAVKDYLKDNFKKENIREASKITNAKGVVTYEAEIRKDLIFDANGKLLNGCCENKNSGTPQEALASFKTHFADAENVKWSEENGKYEAEFELNYVQMSATFESDGNLLETEVAIKISGLPPSVKTYINKNIPGAAIKEAAKITDAGGKITFEAEVNGEDYIFDQNGKFISKSTETPDSENTKK